jgi:hypothetical protein
VPEMLPLTIVSAYRPGPSFEETLSSLAGSGLAGRAVVVCRHEGEMPAAGCNILVVGSLSSEETLSTILGDVRTKYLLLLTGTGRISFEPGALEKMVEAAEGRGAGILYTDFHDQTAEARALHPLIDYQEGSVRDNFDFGAAMLLSADGARKSLEKYGPIPPSKFAALYDLRLKISIDYPVYHLREALYSMGAREEAPEDGEEIFAYVDPRNLEAQKELEAVFTDHLMRIGAHVPASSLKKAGRGEGVFPVEASVVIPVRNRSGTIADALRSALSQETDFPFNVIVVDNHSTDGTYEILSQLSGRHAALMHIVPERTDLGIGGCWNEAIYSPACGRYAVQLDSDDLYSGPSTLKKIVGMLRHGDYAMVVGSYRIVDFQLEEIPPGLIDHREWTDGNGHNNALRVNGLGAPRAFNTDLMRTMGFLNVSYGEDYAAALRMCREYRIGRIFESLYLCRRWQGNTDAALSVTEANRNDLFKDKVRTAEIAARKAWNEGS